MGSSHLHPINVGVKCSIWQSYTSKNVQSPRRQCNRNYTPWETSIAAISTTLSMPWDQMQYEIMLKQKNTNTCVKDEGNPISDRSIRARADPGLYTSCD